MTNDDLQRTADVLRQIYAESGWTHMYPPYVLENEASEALGKIHSLVLEGFLALPVEARIKAVA